MLNVQHLVDGVRALDAVGCSHAAISLVRMLFEYAVGLLWLADSGQDAADVLNIRLHSAKQTLDQRLQANPGWRAAAPPESLAILTWFSPPNSTSTNPEPARVRESACGVRVR
jgi:hypothetical protein